MHSRRGSRRRGHSTPAGIRHRGLQGGAHRRTPPPCSEIKLGDGDAHVPDADGGSPPRTNLSQYSPRTGALAPRAAPRSILQSTRQYYRDQGSHAIDALSRASPPTSPDASNVHWPSPGCIAAQPRSTASNLRSAAIHSFQPQECCDPQLPTSGVLRHRTTSDSASSHPPPRASSAARPLTALACSRLGS